MSYEEFQLEISLRKENIPSSPQSPLRVESSELPPPNPILNIQNKIADPSPKAVFKPLKKQIIQQDNKNDKEIDQIGDDSNQVINNQNSLQYAQRSNELIEESTIQIHYEQIKAELIYKKFNNSEFNIIPSEETRFFSSAFLLPSEIMTSNLGKSMNRENNVSIIKENSKIGDIEFDSRYESGNLFATYKINEREYDLILQNDINSKGNTQWFYFSVKNTRANHLVRFNIVNLIKDDSLFNYGMKPVVYSSKAVQQGQQGWKRDGFQISYERSQIKRESSQKPYYKLSFSYQFQYSNDTVFFAHCYPYTFSDLNQFTSQLLSDPKRSQFISEDLLCYSVANFPCNIYTIQSNKKETNDQKQFVFLIARQHPGETPSSFMIQGIIDFLTDPENEEANFLRSTLIFKIIPMMNPDGVIFGNYRCSISGVDLNRQWASPSSELHPTVFFTKKMILSLCKNKNYRLLCDFHGHSKKMNSFFYGNPFEQTPQLPKLLPVQCSQLNKGIDFKSCSFNISVDKASTFRQAFFELMPMNPFIYTFEASFFGSFKQEKNHFMMEDYCKLGKDVIKVLGIQIKGELSKVKYKEEMCFKLQKLFQNQIKSNHQENFNEIRESKRIISEDGSDSSPSEDELSESQIASINNFKKQQNILKQISQSLPKKQKQNKEFQQQMDEVISNFHFKDQQVQTDDDASLLLYQVDVVNADKVESNLNPFSNQLINSAIQNKKVELTQNSVRKSNLVTERSTNQSFNENDLTISTYLINNKDENIFEKDTGVFPFLYDHSHQKSTKSRTLNSRGKQNLLPLKLSSYGQKVPKEVATPIQQELLAKTLKNRLFISGIKYSEDLLSETQQNSPLQIQVQQEMTETQIKEEQILNKQQNKEVQTILSMIQDLNKNIIDIEGKRIQEQEVQAFLASQKEKERDNQQQKNQNYFKSVNRQFRKSVQPFESYTNNNLENNSFQTKKCSPILNKKHTQSPSPSNFGNSNSLKKTPLNNQTFYCSSQPSKNNIDYEEKQQFIQDCSQKIQYNKNHLYYISPKKKKQYLVCIRKKDSMPSTAISVQSNSPTGQLILKNSLPHVRKGSFQLTSIQKILFNIPSSNNVNQAQPLHSNSSFISPSNQILRSGSLFHTPANQSSRCSQSKINYIRTESSDDQRDISSSLKTRRLIAFSSPIKLNSQNQCNIQNKKINISVENHNDQSSTYSNFNQTFHHHQTQNNWNTSQLIHERNRDNYLRSSFNSTFIDSKPLANELDQGAKRVKFLKEI